MSKNSAAATKKQDLNGVESDAGQTHNNSSSKGETFRDKRESVDMREYSDYIPVAIKYTVL